MERTGMSTSDSLRVRAVSRLSWLLAALSAFAALAGVLTDGGGGRRVVETVRGTAVTLYGQGLYEFDTFLVGSGNRGQDLVILLVEVPALILCIRWYLRGSLPASLALSGVLAFFVYFSASLTFATAQNPVFVVYVAMLGVSIFAFVLAVTRLDAGVVRTAFPPRPSRVALATYLFAVAAALSLAWVPDLVSVTLSADSVSARLVGPYTSMVTHALDLGIVVPVVFFAGAQLLRRAPSGYLLTVLVLVLNVCIGALLLGAGVAQLVADVPLTPAQIVAKMLSFAILTFVAGGLLVTLYRSASSHQPDHRAQTTAPAGKVGTDESSRRL
jgi:hypothetical protein